MPNFDGGQYFLTVLAPVKNDKLVLNGAGLSSPVHVLRQRLEQMPTALQTRVTQQHQKGVNSPFARNRQIAAHKQFIACSKAPTFDCGDDGFRETPDPGPYSGADICQGTRDIFLGQFPYVGACGKNGVTSGEGHTSHRIVAANQVERICDETQ